MGRFENYFFDDEILVYLTYFCILSGFWIVAHFVPCNRCFVFLTTVLFFVNTEIIRIIVWCSVEIGTARIWVTQLNLSLSPVIVITTHTSSKTSLSYREYLKSLQASSSSLRLYTYHWYKTNLNALEHGTTFGSSTITPDTRGCLTNSL